MNPETYNEFPGIVDNAIVLLQRIEKVIPLNSSLVALDFGAGTGLVTLQLLPKVGKVYVLDPAKEMLDKFEKDVAATGLRNYELCNGTIADFTFPPLDIVTCSLSLHHTPDVRDALVKIFNALKPGGHLFVVEKAECGLELTEAGFVDIASELHQTVDVTMNDGTTVSAERTFFSAIRPVE
jgi:ubiquinone/menaquinone biosynthesis C-methylase UbiE